MAISMRKSYVRFISSRQAMLELWHESYIHHQHYHTTPAYYKQRKRREEKKENSKKFETVEGIQLTHKSRKFKQNSIPSIEVWRNITIQELADSANTNVQIVLNTLNMMGITTFINSDDPLVNSKLIADLVKKLGFKVKFVPPPDMKVEKKENYKDIVSSPPADESVLVKRHPVVTIMGHVDHGKTTLLDSLRNTSVVETEFGGITQHIGAFDVTLKTGERVTFLDTPGHAAFTAMRYRGAIATDIVVLVVAADDGVKDQTLQSIEMAKNAKVPIIVAINKIDKPTADIKRTKQMLAEHDIIVEDLGGAVQCVNISALKGTNLDILTEAIALQAELMDLKGDPVGLVEAIAIECTNHPGRGKLVTALIKRGTLKKGCLLVSELTWAKVRNMFNENGRTLLEAKPSEAVQIIGWKELPPVGAQILQAPNEQQLRSALNYRTSKANESLAQQHQKGYEEKYKEQIAEYKRMLNLKWELGWRHPMFKKSKSTSKKEKEEKHDLEFNCIIKGDVAGTIEAILNIFDTYTEDHMCKLNVVHYNVGPVTESDIALATTFNAIIYCFNVDILRGLENEATKKGVQVRKYNVIYKLVDNIKAEINTLLPSVAVEEVLGEATVLQEFKINEKNKKVTVAGCVCTKGVLEKSEMYHLINKNEIIYTGKLVSMRHLKDEVTKIDENVECGLRLDNPTLKVQPGDTLVCFTVQNKAQTISWDPGF